jgi:outer membrane protein OmpA-like peptidoglycan-associated protein
LKNIIKILTTIQLTLLLVGCATTSKNIQTKDLLENSSLLSNFKQNLKLKDKQLDYNLSLIVKTDKYIKINFPKNAFAKCSSIITPIVKVEILDQLTHSLKKFPTIIIQINTYSNDLIKEEENIDLANNRAFNIAEIIDNSHIKNEMFAKGYPSKDNKKVEIFLYEDIQSMIIN